MYQSLFSYNISRPYPFPWFTWVVVLGGIAATALVSTLNVAVAGYELYTISTTNPNATMATHTWFGSWPSFIVGTHTSCESSTIPLQTRLYSNNTAFPYTLSSVWSIDKDGQVNNSGSLIYNNQPIRDCNISGTITIDINVDTRQGGQMALLPVGATITTGVTCAIDNTQGRTYFQIYGTYDPMPPPGDPSMGNHANGTTQTSLWWGQSIMRLYWASLMQQYYFTNVNLPGDQSFHIGVINLNRAANTPNVTAEEVMGIDFFNIWCGFSTRNGTGIGYDTSYCNDLGNVSALLAGDLMPSIWSSVNVLAKATYFSMLADLGRDNSSGPNMLADPYLLTNLSSNMTIVNASLTPQFRAWLPSDEEEQSYNVSRKDLNPGPLGISPAILTTNYICQVPRMKSIGTLFLSVLVADLVLLQTLWTIFKLVVDTFLIGNRSKLKGCEGCAVSSKLDEDEPLVEK
jgi:hypothetical protein